MAYFENYTARLQALKAEIDGIAGWPVLLAEEVNGFIHLGYYSNVDSSAGLVNNPTGLVGITQAPYLYGRVK